MDCLVVSVVAKLGQSKGVLRIPLEIKIVTNLSHLLHY